MYGSNAQVTIDMRMKNCDIAKPDYPFRPGFELIPLQFIDNANCTIATPCAHNRLDMAIIQHFLKITGPFFITATKCKISFADCVTGYYPVSPAFDQFCGRPYFLDFHVPGRRCNPNTITFFYISRNYP